MRAILYKELGPADKLVIEDVPSPQVSGDGVKVKVKAAGLNFPDTLIIEGKYQIKPELLTQSRAVLFLPWEGGKARRRCPWFNPGICNSSQQLHKVTKNNY